MLITARMLLPSIIHVDVHCTVCLSELSSLLNSLLMHFCFCPNVFVHVSVALPVQTTLYMYIMYIDLFVHVSQNLCVCSVM